MTAALHVSFNLLILYHICDMAKKIWIFAIIFMSKILLLILLHLLVVNSYTKLVHDDDYMYSSIMNSINFVDSPWQQALSTFQSFERNDRRVDFWTYDIPTVLTLQEGASGMDIKKGGIL